MRLTAPARSRLLALFTVALMGGCVLGEVDLEGLSCPCADGWRCDDARGICVREGDGPDAAPMTDGGPVDSGASVDSGPGSTEDAGSAVDGGQTPDGGRDAGPPDAGVDAGPMIDAGPPLTPIADGAVVRVDLGPTSHASWPALGDTTGSLGPLDTVAGDPTDVVFSTLGFSGDQNGGSTTNAFGWPGQVSRDTLWVGTFDGHDAALLLGARFTVAGLPAGRYRVEVFASRDGDDGGIGRLGRYTIGTTSLDMDPSDNTTEILTFSDVRPDASGVIDMRVEISPAGTGRFAYVGAVIVTRLGS